MQAEIEHELATLRGKSSCIVIRLEEAAPTELVSINSEQRFPAASLAKVPILVEVARQVEFGMLAWDTRYTIPTDAHAASSGVLADLTADLRPTLRDLAHLMIAISDNTASNVLLDIVGMEAVNVTMHQLGLYETRIERHFMDNAARTAGQENWTTAGDMALLLSFFCADVLPGRDEMLKMLLRQNDDVTICAYWDDEIPYAHKTGELAGILHDAGILNPPYPQPAAQPPLIIVVMTTEQNDVPLTRYTMARIGRIILLNEHR
ncbi:MAG: serine hydrolase [Ktedonobacteraceae bacterium]